MSFLQPILLVGLPLALLPVIIHLINQHRHRTVRWAAMMFLLDAKKMTKGLARLRQILILTMRVLAIAALVFAASRPLAGGWIGLAGGKAAHDRRRPFDDDHDRGAGLGPQSCGDRMLDAEQHDFRPMAPRHVHQRRALHVEHVQRTGLSEAFAPHQWRRWIDLPQAPEAAVTGFSARAREQ
jgi:hypothetical protein